VLTIAKWCPVLLHNTRKTISWLHDSHVEEIIKFTDLHTAHPDVNKHDPKKEGKYPSLHLKSQTFAECTANTMSIGDSY